MPILHSDLHDKGLATAPGFGRNSVKAFPLFYALDAGPASFASQTFLCRSRRCRGALTAAEHQTPGIEATCQGDNSERMGCTLGVLLNHRNLWALPISLHAAMPAAAAMCTCIGYGMGQCQAGREFAVFTGVTRALRMHIKGMTSQETRATDAAESSSWQCAPPFKHNLQAFRSTSMFQDMPGSTSTTSSRTWLESWPRAAESDSKA